MDDNKSTIIISEGYTFCNGKLISHDIKEVSPEWFKLEEDPVYQRMLKKIGIGSINSMYINTNEIQDTDYEYTKITKFLKKYIEKYAKENNLNMKDLNIEFINYGKTELVYVLEEKNGNSFHFARKNYNGILYHKIGYFAYPMKLEKDKVLAEYEPIKKYRLRHWERDY